MDANLQNSDGRKDSLIKLLTHSGKFHLDETIGYVILKAALGQKRVKLTRSRDINLIAEADIVWDVGNIYEPRLGRFDHHMRGGPKRSCGTPYSSAGLLWSEYGRAAIQALFGSVEDKELNYIWSEIDKSLILPCDMNDNGISSGDGLSLSNIVESFNPNWDSEEIGTKAIEDINFIAAADMIEEILIRSVLRARSKFAALDVVMAAFSASEEEQILELPRFMPWQEAVHKNGLDVMFAIYPDSSGEKWMVQTMPKELGGMEPMMAFPEEWSGRSGAELARLSCIPGAEFCHTGRFVAAAQSREAALSMAKAAIVNYRILPSPSF
jgi:uncharacterized UPF0160 family protein